MFMFWYVILYIQGGLSVINYVSLNVSEVRLVYLKEIYLFIGGGVFIENYVLYLENFLLKCLIIFLV